VKSQQEVDEERQLTVKRHMGLQTLTDAVVYGCKTWSVVLWEEHVYCCSCLVCVVILYVFVVLCGHCFFFFF